MAYYYVDYTNGNNARTGLRIPAGAHDSTSYYQIDSSADTTHFVDSALGGYATSALVGSYFYNVSRTAGALITANTTGTGAVTIGTAIGSMAAGDNYYILDSYKDVNTFTATSRSAGDICYLRANMTHTQGAADITTTSGGSTSLRIGLYGANVTQGIDPWNDASDVRATVDFGNGAYNFVLSTSYWDVRNIKFYNSADANGCVYTSSTSNGVHYFYNCLWLAGATANYGVYVALSVVEFESCVFQGTGGGSRHCLNIGNGGRAYIKNTTFDATTTSGYAIQTDGGWLYAYNCTFGGTNTFTTDIYANRTKVYLDACVMSNTTSILIGSYDSFVFSENHGRVFGTHKTWESYGTVEKDTSVVRTGGAPSSAKITTATGLGILTPLTLGGRFPKRDFSIWCPASSTTITVYIRSLGTWSGTYPTASELWLEAQYVSNASTGVKTTVSSTQTLTDETTWVAFTTTFNPAAAGFAYITVNLAKYTSACGIYVDVKPVVS